MIMSKHELSEHLKRVNIAQVNRDTGISRPTLTTLRDLSRKNYDYTTIEQLSIYFAKENQHGEK